MNCLIYIMSGNHENVIIYEGDKQQMVAFGEIKPVNFWHFCMKTDFKKSNSCWLIGYVTCFAVTDDALQLSKHYCLLCVVETSVKSLTDQDRVERLNFPSRSAHMMITPVSGLWDEWCEMHTVILLCVAAEVERLILWLSQVSGWWCVHKEVRALTLPTLHPQWKLVSKTLW